MISSFLSSPFFSKGISNWFYSWLSWWPTFGKTWTYFNLGRDDKLRVSKNAPVWFYFRDGIYTVRLFTKRGIVVRQTWHLIIEIVFSSIMFSCQLKNSYLEFFGVVYGSCKLQSHVFWFFSIPSQGDLLTSVFSSLRGDLFSFGNTLRIL